METLLLVEIISVLFNVIFLVLLTKEYQTCWIYGILGSLTGAYVFFESGYFSETILYLFYAAVGVYGYYYWDKNSEKVFTVKRSSVLSVTLMIIAAAAAGFGLGYVMSKTNALNPYYDAMSTAFGVLATFLELYKYFVAWFFWILINGYTIWLYGIKDLNFLAFQMIVYTALSFYGLVTWHKKLQAIT